MRDDFMSRKEKHEEAIEKFIKDTSQESIELILYNSEIQCLERRYPEIIILKNSIFRVPLFKCTVLRR